MIVLLSPTKKFQFCLHMSWLDWVLGWKADNSMFNALKVTSLYVF